MVQMADQPCSGSGLTLDGSSGTISFMDTYDHNTQCHWHVHCPSGQVASFDFVHMDTEGGFDFVSIFNGQANSQPSSSALLRASGAMSNLPATSVSTTSNDGTLEFTSDGSVAGPGFEVDYNCGTVDPCAGINCGSHGTCAVGQCDCEPAYSGSRCSVHDLCYHVSCSGHGTCTQPTGSCQCNDGYTGATCSTYNPCFQVDCGHGRCRESADAFGDEFRCECDEFYSGRQCENLDPCHRDMKECNEPHPASVCTLPEDASLPVEDRQCNAANLRTRPWWRPKTPADEFPSVRHVCESVGHNGLAALIERTAEWLDRAEDYRMQAAETNAGIITQQLCLERRFETLLCLSDSGNMDRLSELFNEACEIAHTVRQGHSVDSMLLETTDVRGLTFAQYSTTFDLVSHYVATLLDDRRTVHGAADLRTLLAREHGNAALNAHDEQGLWQDKVNDDQRRMETYRSQIADLQDQIDQKMASIGVDGPSLLGSVSSQIQESTQAFRRAVGVATMRREEREALQRSIQQMQRQTSDLQHQMNGLQADQQEMRSTLQRQIQTLQQRQDMAQHQVSTAEAGPDSTLCSGNCVLEQPFSNGCGNDFMGAFHSCKCSRNQDRVHS